MQVLHNIFVNAFPILSILAAVNQKVIPVFLANQPLAFFGK
jgi:hypothetical protein